MIVVNVVTINHDEILSNIQSLYKDTNAHACPVYNESFQSGVGNSRINTCLKQVGDLSILLTQAPLLPM